MAPLPAGAALRLLVHVYHAAAFPSARRWFYVLATASAPTKITIMHFNVSGNSPPSLKQRRSFFSAPFSSPDVFSASPPSQSLRLQNTYCCESQPLTGSGSDVPLKPSYVLFMHVCCCGDQAGLEWRRRWSSSGDTS